MRSEGREHRECVLNVSMKPENVASMKQKGDTSWEWRRLAKRGGCS